MKTKPLTPLTLLTLLAAASSSVSAANYTGGHADIGVALEGGTDFHLHFHAHENAVIDGVSLLVDEEFVAGAITITVPNSVSTVLGTGIPATGVDAGESIWILPQSNPNTGTIPFLGMGTEELTASDWSGGITFTLGAVTSPSGSGDFSLWQSTGIGGLDFYFSTADESLSMNGNNTLIAAAGGHDHYNFGFSETGVWAVELTVSGDHTTLGALSDTQTFEFSVVPEPSSAALLFGLAATGFIVRRRRA
ncbi:MAG: hypothetical protein ACI9A1_000886 [Lentimonas sp.]|jgi:hypothetical protein